MLVSMFDVPEIAPEQIRRLSRREYDRMVELAMFQDERVELLYGVVVTMSPQGVAHLKITAWLQRQLIRALDDTFEVFGQGPFAASDESEPEPDVYVTLASTEFILPSAALLLVEVSESSIRKDRKVKARLYAEAGVPEYWIVDLTGDEISVEVHTEPSPEGYRMIEVLGPGRVLRPKLLPAVSIAVADIPWPRS